MSPSQKTSGSYDFAVIGGGSAGLTAARFAARLGGKVVIIEAGRLGGDCTWTGCVPSKTLLRAARAAHEACHSDRFGISAPNSSTNFPALMDRLNAVIEAIYRPESPEQLRAEGIETIFGKAEFMDAHTVNVGDSVVSFRRLLLATGARPSAPPIPGLGETGYLTYETIWDLAELPERLLVIGGGPIGCEIAQAFTRLGSAVVLFEAAPRLLPNEDTEASAIIESALAGEGTEVRVSSAITQVKEIGDGYRVETAAGAWQGDKLLVATGRQPNLDGLNLEQAGVEYSRQGIKVDRYLRTSQRHIWAAGDCTGAPQFTHYAGWQGFMAARNALLPGKSKARLDAVPRAVFTDPEVAQTGLTEAQAREQFGDSVETAYWAMKDVDRAVIDGNLEGFLKVIIRRNGKILGATIVSPTAGEAIHQWSLAISQGLKLGDLANTMHVYPTYSIATMQLAAERRVSDLLQGVSGKLVRFLSGR